MENPFPLGIFPKSLQKIVRDVNQERKFPIDYLGGAILWVISVLIGATSYLKTTLGKTYCNIFLMLVGVQGAVKSKPLSWSIEYLCRLDEAALTKLDQELVEYDAAIARGEHPEKPIAQRLLMDASTPEAFFRRLSENPKGIGQCALEIKKAFTDLGRYAKSSDEELFIRLFDGDTMTIDRAHQETLHVSRPFFCLSGTIQNDIIKRVFTQDRIDNGLFARFIEIVHYDEPALLWNLTEDLPSDVDIRYENFVVTMLERRDSIDIQHPLEYTLATDAAEVLQAWQNGTEIEIELKGSDSDRATFRKIQIYVLKFALIIQILADLDSGHDNSNRLIDINSAGLATALADYFYQNAKDLAQAASDRELSKKERSVYDALPDMFTSEEGLKIAKRNNMGKTCFFDFLNHVRGVLIDQPARGKYVKRYSPKTLTN
jgi:hypothetical protein